MSKFFTVLTTIGEAKLANATALGETVKFEKLAIGDGNGELPVPNQNQTALINEVRRSLLNSVETDPENPNWIICEQIIPENVGGWTIREVGIYDVDGDLVVVGNFPETYKPVLEEGSGRTQTVRIVLQVSSTATVELKIDPSVVLATREYVDKQDESHVNAGDPHTQYLKKTEKAASAATADTIGVTNLNRASSGVVTITSAAWFGAQPIGLSSMVQLNSAYLPVSVGSGYGYIFKLNARDISGGSAWIFMDNIKPPAKLWLGIAHDTTSAPTWVSLFSSGNLPAISNVIGLSDALSGLSQALQDHSADFDPHHYYDAARSYIRGEIVTITDNGQVKQFLCNQAHTAENAVDPLSDVSDTWRQYPYKEINNANGRAFLYADGTCMQLGSYTHNQGTGSVERNFPVPFTSTKSIVPSSFADSGGATYLCGISFVGLSAYRTAINVYFSPAGTMFTNSTNNTPLICWLAFGRWVEEV
ncbi:phage tail protein [Vibrio fluvialis]|nr:phage tail protein [Vibrio fluvialis]